MNYEKYCLRIMLKQMFTYQNNHYKYILKFVKKLKIVINKPREINMAPNSNLQQHINYISCTVIISIKLFRFQMP